MKVADVQIEFIDASLIQASWTGIDGYTSWIFANGTLWQAIEISGTSKTVEISIDTEKPVNVEIHELETGIEQESANETPHVDNPYVFWSRVDTAASYIIDGRHEDETRFTRLEEATQEPDRTFYEKYVQQDMHAEGGAYWWMKVLSVSSVGIESAKDAWPYHLKGLPPEPTGAELVRIGSGPTSTFTLTLTV